MRQKVARLCLRLLVATGAAGCGSGTPSTAMMTGGTGGADFIDCAAETRATPYTPGMKEPSLAGAWVVRLLDNTFLVGGKPQSQPPAKGSDTWIIEVDDASGRPTDGVVTGVSPYMPDHRHGTTPVMVVAAGSGTYTLAPLYLYMSGYWEITVALAGTSTAGAANTDSAMFPICIPD